MLKLNLESFSLWCIFAYESLSNIISNYLYLFNIAYMVGNKVHFVALSIAKPELKTLLESKENIGSSASLSNFIDHFYVFDLFESLIVSEKDV